MRRNVLRRRGVVLPALVLVGLAALFGLAGGSPAAPPLNAIQIENAKPGTPGWDDFAAVAQQDAINGFGSKISVNHGDSLDLYVTTTAASFTIDPSPRRRARNIFPRFDDNARVLREAYRTLVDDVRAGRSVTGAAEWLLAVAMPSV